MSYHNTHSEPDDQVATLIELGRAARNIRTMSASDFLKIAGIKSDTMRKARFRARQRGQPVPAPLLEDSHSVDLFEAVKWLQRTGRYNALMRLHAHFDDMMDINRSLMRGIDTKHNIATFKDISKMLR